MTIRDDRWIFTGALRIDEDAIIGASSWTGCVAILPALSPFVDVTARSVAAVRELSALVASCGAF
jgi:hypothetical protein